MSVVLAGVQGVSPAAAVDPPATRVWGQTAEGTAAALSKDGFPAVDHIVVNWLDQAARMAQDYLDFTAFSRSGLIDQLMFEGFSYEQAVYGVNAAGL